MRNISWLWQGPGLLGLVLAAGLASSTSGAIRNAWPEGAGMVEVLACAAAEVSNKEISQRSLAAKALTQEQYRSELEKLGVLDRAKDFDGVVRVANDLNNRWGQSGGQYYGLLMLEIGNLLENHFSREGIFAVSQKYVSDALAKSETLPLLLEIRLLAFLSRDIASPDSSDKAAWTRERRAEVRLWLHAWRRLEQEINRDFDFSDRPKLNVSPPDETGLPAGIVPEGIKNHKLRAQYEAALAANAKKAREHNRQFELRKLDETFPKTAENYLVRVYSKPPFQAEELMRYLLTYRLNRQVRERVLSQVRKNLELSR